MGWNVDEVVAYRTVSAAIDDSGRLACAAADAVVFTSGSTVDSLVDAVEVDGLRIVASIGPATSAVAAEQGVDVDVGRSAHDPRPRRRPRRSRRRPSRAAARPAGASTPSGVSSSTTPNSTPVSSTASIRARCSPPTSTRSRRNGLFVVVRLDGHPVGCGALKRSDPAVIDIKRMWLRSDVRGQGLGRALLGHLMDEAGRWVSTGFGRYQRDARRGDRALRVVRFRCRRAIQRRPARHPLLRTSTRLTRQRCGRRPAS